MKVINLHLFFSSQVPKRNMFFIELYYVSKMKVFNLYLFFFTGTKETAFIYAITSAGVVHAVTQSCSAGNLTDCTCDMSYEGESVDGWKWGGCSDNIKYGVWFGKTFVDAPDKTAVSYRRRAVREMMNLHNNEVGRKVGVWTILNLKCTVKAFNSCTMRPDFCQCMVVQIPMDNMSKKPSTSMTT